ncbi:hypothetical protein CDCA_CDCA04G1232 [Cyanidium caldarium]|uniref:Lipid-A-disaccharide synthase n=1 Tax=Cyanidium caldarium TaxID=2771 RepID=A0AAV9ISH3_CYACA|nr:hypothetical protein CDCA_CDCA04G1232 [Cyanidium caldarium]
MTFVTSSYRKVNRSRPWNCRRHRQNCRGVAALRWQHEPTAPRPSWRLRVLCLSNGHGEDVVATEVLRALLRISPFAVRAEAMPLVGTGRAYSELQAALRGDLVTADASARIHSVELIGPKREMPSGGFVLGRPAALVRDVWHGLGWLLYEQWRVCRRWPRRGAGSPAMTDPPDPSPAPVKELPLVLAVGDVLPLWLASVTGVPQCAFVGTAKSELYVRSLDGRFRFAQPRPHRLDSDAWTYHRQPECFSWCRDTIGAPREQQLRLWWRWALLAASILHILWRDVQYAGHMCWRHRLWRFPLAWRLRRFLEALSCWHSVYYPWERRLMRQCSGAGVFVRDALTAQRLQQCGVVHVCTDASGNPMMDGFAAMATSVVESADREMLRLALLPGSRVPEAYKNFSRMLQEAAEWLAREQQRIQVEVPAAGGLERQRLMEIACAQGWMSECVDGSGKPGSCRYLRDRHGRHRLVVLDTTAGGGGQRLFYRCLARADVVFACAGTATEQAVGIGKPVVTTPGAGPQFTRDFWEAQARLLGANVILADPTREHPHAASEALRNVCAVLRDAQQAPQYRNRWRANGVAVMGRPGAADRIAQRLMHAVHREMEERGAERACVG